MQLLLLEAWCYKQKRLIRQRVLSYCYQFPLLSGLVKCSYGTTIYKGGSRGDDWRKRTTKFWQAKKNFLEFRCMLVRWMQSYIAGCQENPYPYPLPEMRKPLPLLRKPLPQRLESNFSRF